MRRQLARARELTRQGEALLKTLETFSTDSKFPAQQLLPARKVLSLMQTAERELLAQRTEAAKSNASRSLAIGVSFTVFALVVVLILFGLPPA